MRHAHADIISRLQKEILPLQGFKPKGKNQININLGDINLAFPNKTFPLGAIHEFICPQNEDTSATTGFISGIISHLLKNEGVALWVSAARKIFPPSLLQFGIDPARIIFIDVNNEKDVFWTTRECLKCYGVCAVIGEIKNLDFTQSRKLQLAVEDSRVTGFILRTTSKIESASSCMTRWRISSLPSNEFENLPGVGSMQWNIILEKVRNGRPGKWTIGWIDNDFLLPSQDHHHAIHENEHRKVV